MARKIDLPLQKPKTQPPKILKKEEPKTKTFESKIPTINKSQSKPEIPKDNRTRSPIQRNSRNKRRITFEEPCRSEPKFNNTRGLRNLKGLVSTNITEQRAAGIPSIQNRWDADWIKLTKNDRPNSVPTRISRFTQKASNKWRTGDNSAFEYDRPRIKRSGPSSRGSQKSPTLDIYPDWWGDGSQYNSRSTSRCKMNEDGEDDFDRKVAFNTKRNKILKNVPQQNTNAIKHEWHPSDETSPNEDESEECTEETNEEVRQVRKPMAPIVSSKQKQGTIYSKLHGKTKNMDEEEPPVKMKQSKSGYAITFSPNTKKKKRINK